MMPLECGKLPCHWCHDSCQPYPTIWNHFKSSANKLILVPQSDGLFWDLPRYRQGKRTPKGTNFPVKRLPMRRLYGPKGWCNLTISHNVTLTVCWSRKPPFLLTLLSQCSGESLQNHCIHPDIQTSGWMSSGFHQPPFNHRWPWYRLWL